MPIYGVHTVDNNEGGQGDQVTRLQVASFADLKDNVTTHLEFERHDGSIMTIPVREISYGDWLAIERQVPYPTPPRGGADKSGRPWYDVNDQGYIEQAKAAEDRRAYLRILRALAVDERKLVIVVTHHLELVAAHATHVLLLDPDHGHEISGPTTMVGRDACCVRRYGHLIAEAAA
jgi:hypothetical protein